MATAQDRGWGPAWPDHCDDARARCVEVTAAGVRLVVRAEVADLMRALVQAWHEQVEALDPAGCWSFACRAVRGSTAPSNHSWGLAVDLNAPRHPLGRYGTFTAAQARAVRVLLARPEFARFRWGGDYANRPDEMHLEYVGTVAEAAADTATLHAQPEDDMTKDEHDTLMALAARLEQVAKVQAEHGRELDLIKTRSKTIIDGDANTPGLRQISAAVTQVSASGFAGGTFTVTPA